MSVTPTPSCADARSDDNPASENMSRETKPTKVREITNRFGIAEPSIGALLKVSLYKILPSSLFVCEHVNVAHERNLIFYLFIPREHPLRLKTQTDYARRLTFYTYNQQATAGSSNGTRSRYTNVKTPVKTIRPRQTLCLTHL